MPVQDLRAAPARSPGHPATRPSGALGRRAGVIGGAALLTLYAAYQMYWVLGGAATVLGWIVLAPLRRPVRLDRPRLHQRTRRLLVRPART